MKKIFFLAIFFISLFFQESFGQDSITQKQLSQLLSHYYGMKDALVSGNPNSAALKADDFIKTANSIDYKVISEGNINALLKDAGPISETHDIKKQRSHFSNLSENMATLAKVTRFGYGPVYRAYCPMKKASWLSAEKAIKNPYYGNAMLTCGEVVDTLNQ
jgi:hypothetical protein